MSCFLTSYESLRSVWKLVKLCIRVDEFNGPQISSNASGDRCVRILLEKEKKNLAILKVSRQWLLLVVELERESNDVEEATIRKRDNRRRHETSPFLSVTLEFPRMICSAWPIERQSKTLELNNLIYKMRIFITFGWHPGHPNILF